MATSPGDIRLLLVDDEAEFLEAIRPGLARRGFHVTTAESGQAALQQLRSEEFHVVVLDVKMPGIDGVDTFREIRRIAPSLPVIMLTGHGSIQQAFETSREGVYDYLAKPCDVERLATIARQAVADRAESKAPTEPAADDIRLLLVDDDRELVESLTLALERRGVTVTTALDGTTALARVEASQFDVAVVDVRMPDMDGLNLLNRLRKNDPLLEVIVLTGHPAVDDARRGLKQGAFDYLTKPQRVEDLLLHVRSAADRRHQRLQERQQAEIDRIVSQQPD